VSWWKEQSEGWTETYRVALESRVSEVQE
jgi:hypothetical protein